MYKNLINNIHPGEILKEEFMIPLDICPYCLSKIIKIPYRRIAGILNKKCRISNNDAIKLARYLQTSKSFWIGLQIDYDLENDAKN